MNKSLNRQIILFSFLTTSIFLIIVLVTTYLFFRQNMNHTITQLSKDPMYPVTSSMLFLKLNTSEIVYESQGISESKMVGLFWQQYQPFFIIFFTSGLFFIGILTVGIKFVLSKSILQISYLASLKKEESNEDDIPKELRPFFYKIRETEANIEKVTKQNNQFRSFASHELRNQIAELQSLYYQLNINDEVILKRTQGLTNTVENLLSLAYIPSDIQVEPLDFVLLVASCVDKFAGNEIHFTYDDVVLGGKVQGAEVLLERLVFNLLDNAVKYKVSRTNVMVNLVKKSEETLTLIIKNQSMHASFKAVKGHGIGIELIKHVTQVMNGFYYAEINESEITSIVTFPLFEE